MASAAAAQTRTFDIPAQSAQQGIPQFAQQADLQLIVPEKLAAGQMTSAVRGTMTVQAGLKRLLHGTSLTPVTQSNGAILLTQAAVERVSVRNSAPADIVSAGDAATQHAPASTVAPEQEQVVIVQGIRRSLSKARDIKRHAPNMVESIVAEDIGKMPDLNLAESIQRIPGVAMSREGGEGRNITLRGFGPDFTRTTLNGMEVPAGTDGLDSGGVTLNASRAFDFNVFASELFDRIDVEKTQRASTEEGGIAGTVDLYSAKPFDFDKDFTLSASAQASYNTLTEKSDPRLAFLVSKKFDGGKLGVLFSAAVSRRTVHQEGFSSVRWTSPYINGDSWADTNPQVTGTPSDYCGAANALDCLWAPRLPRADFFGNDQKRVGFTGSVQYKPNQDVLITFDALHSELNNDRYNYNSMEWLLTHGDPGNFTGQTPLSFTVAPDGKQLIAASFDDVTSWYESRHQESKSSFDQYVLSGRFRINDYLTLNAMAGSARDDADRTELRFYVRSVPHYYSYDYSANPYVATVGYGSYDPNDPSNYINALTNVNRINNVLKQNYTSKVSATYADDGFSLQAGVDYNNRKITYAEGYGDMPSFDPASYLTDFPYSDFGRGLDASLHTFQVVDFGAIAASSLISPGYVTNVGGGWSVDEETIGGYVELNSEQRLGDMTLHTNAGVRVVRTNVTSDALVGGTPVQVKHSYDNYLPSLNFALDLREDLVARLAYGRSMTRPNLATLNISGPVFSYDTRSVSNFGNPNLKPYESNDTDLSLEWYFGKTGLLALGVFNKNVVRSLKTEIVNQYIDPAYWPAIYADPRYDASYNADPATTKYTFSIPVNDETDQSVSGVELTYNQPFTFLPGAWKYLGVTSNFTHVSAKDSTGVSPNSYNFTVYYDTGRFGARISVNKRDDYPILALAEKGYAVLSYQTPPDIGFSKGAKTWQDLNRINRIDWMDYRNTASTIDAGIRAAAALGVVDESRLGLTGMSYGGSIAQFELVNSRKFKAAILSTCCEEESNATLLAGPGFYKTVHQMGYPGLTEDGAKFWAPMSFRLNASRVSTPLLLQVPDQELLATTEGVMSLMEAGQPVDMYVYPDETHVKWQPAHRLSVYRRSIQWFDFWLKGIEDQDPVDPGQYKRWQSFRNGASSSLSGSPGK